MPIHIFNTFNDPSGITGTTVGNGVNDADQIVGRYQDATRPMSRAESGASS